MVKALKSGIYKSNFPLLLKKFMYFCFRYFVPAGPKHTKRETLGER